MGYLCRQVFWRPSFSPLTCHFIQSTSWKTLPVVFLSSLQQLGRRLSSTNSPEQSGTSLPISSTKTDSNESTQVLLETFTTPPVEQEKQAGVGHLKLGEAAKPFLDMGLSSDQIMLLFNLQPKLPPPTMLTVVSELLLLGLSPDSMLKALRKNPELLRLSVKHLRDRADLLRRFGFQEVSLNHVAVYFPYVFTLPQKRFTVVEHLLREKCLFTVQQVSKLLQTCPNILLEELNDVEYKFQFAYFRMGVKHKEIVKAGYFQAPLVEIKNRFIFLERLGLYQTPDKKGQTQVVNPKLKGIIRASESDFVATIACSSVEEYTIFKKLLAREEERRQKEEEVMKSELSDVESDEEESDEE
ncbi:transcription termination factor 4, mitochondrial [Varanus komodoensis]|uniref:Transcription termination factor 4, mitochondrial n=1 Tax=Varanus komodoensis TaxID=61221 RepID=A0A8D2Q3F1_VARKO|nr:transcription termination factor 4, mitochondrial [Varanus komodoensis]